MDWCSRGHRGIFARNDGEAFSSENEHTEDEIENILDPFYLVLSPQSILLSEEELKAYHRFVPLSEYSGAYGVVLKDSP